MNNRFPIQIRFCDVDSLGHVNNAVYLSYFEMARMLFMKKYVGKNWDWYNKGMILKKNEVEYNHPLFLYDNLEIEIVPVHLGKTSFTLGYKCWVGDVLKCTGQSVLVCYDFAKKNKNEVYEEFKFFFPK